MKFKKNNLIYLLSFVLIVITFYFFRLSNQQSQEKTQKIIHSFLRNESLIANSYALSKSILDLEKLEIVRCSELLEDFSEKRIFYSTINQNRCYQSKLLRFFNEFSFNSKAVNGLNYKITLQLNMPWQSIALEVLIYFLLVLGAYNLTQYIQKQEEISLIRLKAAEIEKQIFLDKTLQIRHDVASPIASMKLFLDILTDIDPRVKTMLALSIERTQELFNQLSADTQVSKLGPCPINKVLQDIINEKKADSSTGVDFVFSTFVDYDTCINANKIELERLTSNLLNNAIEACFETSVKRIEVLITMLDKFVEIKIVDSGKGIPQNIVEKIGTKGFSYGKENHNKSGSGIGLYHAISSVKSWEGELSISSKENQGTTVVLKIPLFIA